MNKKIIFSIVIVVLLVALSQWGAVKLVYAHKISGGTAKAIASLYNLKAGTIEKDDEKLNVYLTDYFVNKDFVIQFMEKQYQQAEIENEAQLLEASRLSDEEMDEVVWQKIVKDAWLSDLAAENGLEISQEELDEYIELVGGAEYLQEITEDQYGLSFDDYIDLVVMPRVLEEKVYSNLLGNYQDREAVENIQQAYALLEAEEGANWQEVATIYSDDMTYVDNSLWLQEEDLVGPYEAIGYMDVGDFSKVVKVPNGYIIWKLQSLSADEGDRVYEVRSIFVEAMSINDFLSEYLSEAQIKKIY